MKRLAVLLICLIVFGSMCSVSASGLKLVCDAGHGGPDGGAVAADGTLEKDLNLQFALTAADLFRFVGVSTTLTRTDDRSIHDSGADTIRKKKVSDIKNRLSMINDTDVELLVSFHQNKFSQPKYRGTQVFYGRLNERSKLIAQSVQKNVKQLMQPENSREAKLSGKSIYLLYHCTKPAILVECGFLSNADELSNLKKREYQKKICFAVMCGVIVENSVLK